MYLSKIKNPARVRFSPPLGKLFETVSRLFTLLFLCFISSSLSLRAQDSLCAEVKIEIQQELSFERQAFDATMRINNGYDDLNIENVAVDVFFTDRDGNEVLASSDPNNTSALFYIRLDDTTNIGNVSGTGTVAADTTATIRWLIIPTAGAGGALSSGTLYQVGANLSYTLGTESVDFQVVPDFITVRPQPRLKLDYFLPKDVYGDDPFTTEVEPAEPFSLGVRVQNSGNGDAHNVAIDSGQPKIVDDEQGLLVGFQIVGSQVNGQDVQTGLKVNFGDIAAGKAATARWIMEASLSGRFEDFGASFSHADELGGKLTSLIDSVSTHTLIHEVLVDQPGRDPYRDFLATNVAGTITRVFETDGIDTDVSDLSGTVGLNEQNGSYIATPPATSGFVYMKMVDPYNGLRALAGITRSDGKSLLPQNAWLSKSYDKLGKKWEHFVSIFDESPLSIVYTLNYTQHESLGNQPPVIAYMNDKTLASGSSVGFLVRASDPNGNIPTLSTGPLPFGAAFVDKGNGTGTFLWTPTSGQTGIYPFDFTASDGELSTTRTVTITVNSSGTNQAPVAADETITPTEDTPYRGYLPADDPDGDGLTFVADTPTSGSLELLDTTSGEYRYTPNPNFDGSDSFTFSAGDGLLTANGVLSIVMRPVNDPPELNTPLLDQDTETGLGYSYVLPSGTFSDPDGDTLAYSVVDLPSWLSFDPATGTFSGTPTSGDVAVSTIGVTATDPSGERASDTYKLTVIIGANGQIIGVCFNDLDGDGVFDVGEPGLEALNVYLDLNGNGLTDAGEPATSTDAQGNFTIDGLTDGNYIVRDDKPADFTGNLPADAHFGAETALSTGTGNTVVLLADLNNDGKNDLVSADEDAGQLAVHLAGTNGFDAPTTYTVGSAPVALAAADFNGDGHLDIATSNATSGTITIHHGQGDGSLLAAANAGSVGQPDLLVTADFDNDGDADLAVADLTDHTIKRFDSNGDGTFSPAGDLDPAGTIIGLITLPIDGQNQKDLVVGTTTGLTHYSNDGTGTFSAAGISLSATPSGLLAADLNNDGFADLILPLSGTQTLVWLPGDGSGSFGSEQTVNAGMEIVDLTALDADGNGWVDLVAADGIAQAITYLQNGGHGQFREPIVHTTTFAADRLTAADSDGDGDDDLVLAANAHLAAAANNQTPIAAVSGGNTVNLSRAAVLKPGFITGTIYDDANGNAAFDVDETGLQGWSLWLDLNDNGAVDPGEALRTTDMDGFFRFADVPEGSYSLALQTQTGWNPTTAVTQTVTVLADTTTGDVDFGNQLLGLEDMAVTSFADGVDALPGDGIVADGNGAATLRAAVMEANALPGENTIVLAVGTYTLSLAGTLEDLAETGDLDITDNLIIRAPGAHLTTVDGGSLDRLFHVAAGVTLQLEGLTLSGGDTGTSGTVGELSGGALYNDGTTTLSAVTLHSNIAEENGGAVASSGTLYLYQSTLHNNSARNGGALHNSGSAVVENSTFSGNSATTSAGALDNSGTLTSGNNTFTANSAGDTGAIRNTGSATLGNTLVAANNAGLDTDLSGHFSSNGGNLIGDLGDATGISNGANGDLAGDDLSPIDPLLDPLAYNGGPTETHWLQAGSPAIDAAMPAALAVDQRGYPRPADGNGNGNSDYDIGALEVSTGLVLTAPNGGETLLVGQPFDVTWLSSGVGGYVDLEVSYDNGASWQGIVAGIQNDGLYSWSPDQPAAEALLRISSASDGTINDTSDAPFSIPAGSLTITSPNGGETVLTGETTMITWESANIYGGFQLELSKDGGTTWTVAHPWLPNSGQFAWAVRESTGSNQARIRLTNTYQATSDMSDADFTIPQPSLQLSNPNGGETFLSDPNAAAVPINWTSADLGGRVDIHLSRDGGTTWEEVSINERNDGGYPWYVTGAGSSTCLVRIASTLIPELSDTSDALFTIDGPTLQLTAPNGGETLNPGTTVSLSWVSLNLPGTVVPAYSTDGGVSWQEIVASTENDGLYDWTVPAGDTTQALIRVSSSDRPDIVDISDAPFAIQAPSITVTAPNGGEVFTAGETTTITWEKTAVDSDVKVGLSLDGGATWQTLANGLTGTSFDWTIGNMNATQAVIHVSSNASTTVGDSSDAYFTLQGFEITAPTAGTQLLPGEQATITWTQANLPGTVDLSLSRDGGLTWESLADDYTGTSFDWTVTYREPTQGAPIETWIRLNHNSITGLKHFVTGLSIPQPLLDITSPNGGESLDPGTVFNLTWNAQNFAGDMDLKLSLNGGTNWQTIANGITGTSYAWTVPNDTSTDAIVKIFSNAVAGLNDQSDLAFTIAQPVLAVTSPNGGETLINGQPVTLTWDELHFAGTVSIRLSTNGGLNWQTVADNVSGGSYEWVVSAAATSDGVLKIYSDAVPGLNDESDAPFTISDTGLTVTAPNGGETLTPGDTVPVTWNGEGLSGNIQLEYSLDGGANWQQIAAGTGNDGEFGWPIPASPTIQGLVRATSLDNPALTDVSDAFFTILEPTLEITSHNGGVVLEPGAITTLQFNAVNFLGGVSFEVSYDGGTNWDMINSSLGYGPNVNWKVPAIGSSQVYFRMTSAYLPELYDITDAANTILTPTLTLTSHNGGETMIPGTNTTIGYQVDNFMGGVTMEVSYDDGTQWNMLNDNMGNGPTMTWYVPATGSSAVRFRVTSRSFPELFHISDGVNTILSPSLSLAAPNGGSLVPGDTIAVNYLVENFAGGVTMEISYDGGANWTMHNDNMGNGPNMYWPVPNTPTDQLRFRVTSRRFPEISDTSLDNTILTPSLTLLTHNGGATLTPGEIVPLSYQVTNFIGGVTMEVSHDGGENWTMLNDNLGNGPTFNWIVTQQGTTSAVFRVTSRYFPGLSDSSDDINTILTPTLQLTSHLGGQSLTVGETTTIGYQVSNLVGGLVLEVSYDGASTWTTIHNNLGNGPTHDWQVSANPSTDVYFRISSKRLPDYEDLSDSASTIANP